MRLKDLYKQCKTKIPEEQAKEIKALLINADIKPEWYKNPPLSWLTHKIETGEIKIL
jgi:hypothetical protein